MPRLFVTPLFTADFDPSGDDVTITEMTRPAVPQNGPQTLGDWVVTALRERDWEGAST